MADKDKDDNIRLQDHLESKLGFLDELSKIRLEHIKEVMRREVEVGQTSIKLQAAETEKRLLEALSKEAEKILHVVSASVSREVYHRDMQELKHLIDELTISSKNYVTKELLANILKIPNEKIDVAKAYKELNPEKPSSNMHNSILFFTIIIAAIISLGITTAVIIQLLR